MSEKPGKRLVSKKEYLQIEGKRTAISTSGTILAFIGAASLFVSVISLCVTIYNGIGWSEAPSPHDAIWAVKLFSTVCAISTAIGVGGLWTAFRLFVAVGRIESVVPITRHNTGQLPAVETLVRASDLPPSHQQAELLRAAPPASETPPEELLRATTGSRLSINEGEGRE